MDQIKEIYLKFKNSTFQEEYKNLEKYNPNIVKLYNIVITAADEKLELYKYSEVFLLLSEYIPLFEYPMMRELLRLKYSYNDSYQKEEDLDLRNINNFNQQLLSVLYEQIPEFKKLYKKAKATNTYEENLLNMLKNVDKEYKKQQRLEKKKQKEQQDNVNNVEQRNNVEAKENVENEEVQENVENEEVKEDVENEEVKEDVENEEVTEVVKDEVEEEVEEEVENENNLNETSESVDNNIKLADEYGEEFEEKLDEQLEELNDIVSDVGIDNVYVDTKTMDDLHKNRETVKIVDKMILEDKLEPVIDNVMTEVVSDLMVNDKIPDEADVIQYNIKPPVKRKRGRPRKVKKQETVVTQEEVKNVEDIDEVIEVEEVLKENTGEVTEINIDI